MKRAVLAAVFLASVATLGGCPIYNHEDDGCYRDSDCGIDYACDRQTGECYLPGNGDSCRRPSDCGVNQTCDVDGRCVAGDCSFNGCVSGYRCDSSSGIWKCVSTAGGGSAGASSSGGSSGMSAGGSAGETSSNGGSGAEPGSAGAGGDAAASGSAGEAGGG